MWRARGDESGRRARDETRAHRRGEGEVRHAHRRTEAWLVTSSTLVRELTEAVEREVDNLLTHGQTAQRRQRREERTLTRRERTMHVAVRH